MEFKFNFDVSDGQSSRAARAPPGTEAQGGGNGNGGPSEAESLGGALAVVVPVPVSAAPPPPPFKEHRPPEEPEQLLERIVAERLELEALPGLRHVNSARVEMDLGERWDGGREAAPSSGSDLVSGVYEGGLKVWECTLDLLNYLAGRRVDFTGKRVLDLGCGAGLLGLLALRGGAYEVHFQDYNSGVIDRVTLPNALLEWASGAWTPSGREDGEEAELPSGEPGQKEWEDERPHKRRKALGGRGSEPGALSRCRFFSGEWSQFGREMLGRPGGAGALRYDFILTSETVYNPQYYGALHTVLSGLLADTGIVYLATKSHYFGVGGGARLYQSFVEERKVFHARTVQVIDEGLQRCIIEMTFKRDK